MDRTPEEELDSLGQSGLLRDLHVLPETGGDIYSDGLKLLNFSSNDYLGLANDRRLKDAAIEAIEQFGVGATASRLLTGHLALHQKLEDDVARMMGTESALVFGSGFLTNLGVLTSIARAGDYVFSDKLNHASLIDGIRLSKAHCDQFRHKDMEHLENLLKKNNVVSGRKIIVSESVFSMDGDIAPVKDLAQLAGRYRAMFVIDEAHAIGVMGKQGGGVCRINGEEVEPDVIVGTLSKALGGYGGFAACSNSLRRLLINKARSFIYSTGLPPACLGSARAAVGIVMKEPELGKILLEKANRFHSLLVRYGVRMPVFESHILPVIIGDNEAVMRFSEKLLENGLLVRGIRPPTVPPGTARVRLSLTLAMTDKSLEKAASIIAGAARETGVACR